MFSLAIVSIKFNYFSLSLGSKGCANMAVAIQSFNQILN